MNRVMLGSTFARGYCEYLGLDPKKTLEEIIKLGLNPIRVGIYWEEVEIKPGVFDFSSFDWIIEKLSKAKVDIILAIGAKTPRWPEFHLPEFIRKKYHFKNKEVIDNEDFLVDIKKYLKAVLEHYESFLWQKSLDAFSNQDSSLRSSIGAKGDKNHERIMYIQVENEPFEPFGPNKWTLSPRFVAKEIKYVRTMTNEFTLRHNAGNFTKNEFIPRSIPNGTRTNSQSGISRAKGELPIIITNGGMDPIPPIIAQIYGKYRRLGECLKLNTDIIGLDIYPIIPQKIFGKFFYFKAGESQWKKLVELKNQIENNKSQKKKVWITELQAEPWEPGKMNTASPLANPSCNPDLVIDYIKKCQQLGFETILLWGAEFWLACKKDGNDVWVESIKNYLCKK